MFALRKDVPIADSGSRFQGMGGFNGREKSGVALCLPPHSKTKKSAGENLRFWKELALRVKLSEL
jgi:hypothetical protein